MTASARSLLFLLGCARTDGNTEILTGAAADGLAETDRQRWIRLDELALPPFQDRRHAGDGRTPPAQGPERAVQEATLAATDIASPLYRYSLSAATKTYLDHCSGWLRVPGLDFKARMAVRRLRGVTVMGDDDPAVAGPLAGTLRPSAEHLSMEWRGVLLGSGSKPGDVRREQGALSAAKTLSDLERDAADTPGILI